MSLKMNVAVNDMLHHRQKWQFFLVEKWKRVVCTRERLRLSGFWRQSVGWRAISCMFDPGSSLIVRFSLLGAFREDRACQVFFPKFAFVNRAILSIFALEIAVQVIGASDRVEGPQRKLLQPLLHECFLTTLF